MTVDSDYELNWNKENIPFGKKQEKSKFVKQTKSKREALSDVSKSLNLDVHHVQVEKKKIEEERAKWAAIAASLQCDPEADEEEYMNELLCLCSWNDNDCEKAEIHSFGGLSDYSDEDDEDEAFMAFIKSQKTPSFKEGCVKKRSFSLLKDLHFSTLRLDSQNSLKRKSNLSNGCCSAKRSDHVSLVENSTKSPTTLGNSCSKSLNGAYREKNVSKNDKKLRNLFTRKSSNSSRSSFEQAFFGVTHEDNGDSQCSNTNESSNGTSANSSPTNQFSNDLWKNVKFTM